MEFLTIYRSAAGVWEISFLRRSRRSCCMVLVPKPKPNPQPKPNPINKRNSCSSKYLFVFICGDSNNNFLDHHFDWFAYQIITRKGKILMQH